AVFSVRISPVGLALFDGLAERARLLNRHSLDFDAAIIVNVDCVDASHRGIFDVLLLEFVFQPLNGLIRLGIDGVVDVYLQDQVSATLKVQSEMNVFLKILDQRLLVCGETKNPIQTGHYDCENKKALFQNILSHQNFLKAKTSAGQFAARNAI